MATQKIETGLIADDAVTSAKIGTLDANLEFGDSVKAIFGAGSDLQIYHDGSNSYIDEQGTGGLVTRVSDFYLRNPSDADMIYASSGAAVKLYHNGSEKLATTSSGIDVTGTVVADGLTVQGAAANYNTIQFTSGSTGHGTIVNLGDTSDADYGSITQFATSAGEGGRMRFIAGTTETMNLRGGNVGIGESSPDTTLHIKKNQSSANSSIKLENAAGGNNSSFSIDWQLASSGTSAQIKADRTNSPGAGDTDLIFSTSTTGTALVEAMRIDYLGNVGINETSPDYKLHISGSGSAAQMQIESTSNSNAQLIFRNTVSSGSGSIGGFHIGLLGDTSGDALIYHHHDKPIRFYTNAANTMTLTGENGMLHLNGRSGAHGYAVPQDESLGYTNNLNAGAFGILHRDSYDSYVTGNAYYYKTGGSSGWRAKYGAYKSTVMGMVNGAFTFDCSSAAPGSNGASVSGLAARVRIDSDGLKFGSDTAAANALDDYEEGTWTPACGATLSTAVGKYTKIGNQVTVHYHIVSTGGLPTSTSQVIITGLPFTSVSGSLSAAPIYARYYTPNDSTLTSLVQDSETQIRLININETNFDYTIWGELEASSNNSIYIIGTATYQV